MGAAAPSPTGVGSALLLASPQRLEAGLIRVRLSLAAASVSVCRMSAPRSAVVMAVSTASALLAVFAHRGHLRLVAQDLRRDGPAARERLHRFVVVEIVHHRRVEFGDRAARFRRGARPHALRRRLGRAPAARRIRRAAACPESPAVRAAIGSRATGCRSGGGSRARETPTGCGRGSVPSAGVSLPACPAIRWLSSLGEPTSWSREK